MFDFQKNFSALVMAFLFCFMLLPQAATAQHASYWCADGRTGDNGTNCGENAWHEDSCEKCKPHLMFRVKSWQKCVSSTTPSDDEGNYSYFITGLCNKDCLSYVEQPKYYDDPEKPGTQAQGDNAAKIKLPVVLAWKDVPGFGDNSSTRALCSGHDSDCGHSGPSPVSGNGYGPITYRIQIWDDSASGIDNLNILQNRLNNQPDIGLVNSGIEDGVNGKRAFFAVLSQSGEKSGFNSRTHGGLCFFNSTDTYHWRVKACCDDAGTSCKDYKPNEWWTFTVGTAPELYNPLDSDWNGSTKSVIESFKDIIPAKEPLKWCAAKLPKEYQIENRPIQYAKSYQLTVTSNEKNDFTDKILNLWKGVSSWYLQAAGLGTGTASQSTHALSAINGSLIYNIFPDPTTEEVETWYPAQSRGDLAFFSRNRTYSWTMKSCPDSYATKCFDDPSQEWKIDTPKETIPAPEAITPKNDSTDNEPAAFPISLSWSIPSGANSFRYETDIPNFTGERKTAWNTIPNNEFDDATRKLLGLENVAIKLDTTYKWRVKSCAMFDSGQSDPADCDDWSAWFSFRTTGRPPRKSSMLPSLDPKIEATFPQNFTWEKVPGAKSYKIKLLDGDKEIDSKTVKFGSQDQGEPGAQFDIEPPADNNSSKTYTWKVQTCADENGKFCGSLWTSQYFMAKRPGFPQNQIQKKIYGSLGGLELKWTGPTKYYWVTINYNKPDPQTQSGCDLKNPIVDKMIDADSCSMQNGCIPSDIKSSCVGTYQWTVQPCANPNCSDRGSDNTLTGYFSVSADATDSNTLSVCGQAFDNPKSEWDETEICEIRHLFLFLKIFIDFLIFRFSIMLLPILVLISGIFFYLGKEGPNTLQYIKDAWKRIGIGYAILFMAWLLTSWLMLAVGYGNIWWKIL